MCGTASDELSEAITIQRRNHFLIASTAAESIPGKVFPAVGAQINQTDEEQKNLSSSLECEFKMKKKTRRRGERKAAAWRFVYG